MMSISPIDFLVSILRSYPVGSQVTVQDLLNRDARTRGALTLLNSDTIIEIGPGDRWVAREGDGTVWVLDIITGWELIPTDDTERRIWEEVLTHSDPPSI